MRVSQSELWRISAVEAVALLQAKEVTPLELVAVAEQRWKETDPLINAMPITCWEQARAEARLLMEQGYPDNRSRGYLYGLPVAVKDLTAVKGLPFTSGSLIHKGRIADRDDPLVQRLREQGAIIVGKTNTPEFGAGSQTYNQVFGTTYNPWDTTKTAGGSSGGSAAAVAAGQVWLATGTDLGGSLRNPASYCGIVGMRCSVGVVPHSNPSTLSDKMQFSWRLRTVSGLLARSVEDLGLGLDAVAGAHWKDSLSLPMPKISFTRRINPINAPSCTRIAFSSDLGGITPICPEVARSCRSAVNWWKQQGAKVIEDQPDLEHASDVFNIVRAFLYRPQAAKLLAKPELCKLLKPEFVWQLEAAAQLNQDQINWAAAAHDQLLEGLNDFFQEYDLLMCPTVMMQPFDATTHWPTEFGNTKFSTYLDWMKTCSVISLLGVPAISVPCGLSNTGLPIGLQIIGPQGRDADVLAAAAAFERAHPYRDQVPLDVVQNKLISSHL